MAGFWLVFCDDGLTGRTVGRVLGVAAMFDMHSSIVGKIGDPGVERGELAELNRRKQQDPQALAL